MNIAIDVTSLRSAHGRRGIGSYTRNLIEALQKYERKHTYSLFTRGQKIPDNADMVHYPYFDPFFLTLPLSKVKPAVVTVHDLIPLVFPDKFPSGFRGAIKWQIQKVSLSGAKRIITDSVWSKNDISKITGIEKNRIDVVYLAPDPNLRRVTDKLLLQTVRKKYSLPQLFILYVGDVNWNKNVSGLLRAFSEAQKSVPARVSLVLVGDVFNDPALPEIREINRLIGSLGSEKRIIRTGFVDSRELSALYSLAVCLVMPSRYEGFGLPVLEAMACGCPVVSTDVSSLKEISGPAITVTAEPSDIASGIQRIFTLNRDEQIRRQKIWVKRFTWERVAKETSMIYEKIFSNV